MDKAKVAVSDFMSVLPSPPTTHCLQSSDHSTLDVFVQTIESKSQFAYLNHHKHKYYLNIHFAINQY